MLGMVARPAFVLGSTKTNCHSSFRYGAGNRRRFGPLEKPIMEGAVPPKGDLTRRNDCLFRSRLIASDQKRELTQKMSFILEAGHDFGRRCVIAGVD
jgi:hypothetical protein